MIKEMKTQADNNPVKTTRNKDVLQHVSHNNLSPDDLSIIYSSMLLALSRKRGLLSLTLKTLWPHFYGWVSCLKAHSHY